MTRIFNNTNNHLATLDNLVTKFHHSNVLTSAWLRDNHISAKLVWWYIHSGRLERIGHQLYKKPNTEVNWGNAVLALQQQLNLPIHIGGLTALAIFGRAHFIPVNGIKQVSLFAKPKTKCPNWLFNNDTFVVEFIIYKPNLFKDYHVHLVETYVNDNKVLVSCPERAILEFLYLIPEIESFDTATLLLKGLYQLRPEVIQELLEMCELIKVKRIFLALAEQFNLPCLQYINLANIDLGRGKYVIGEGGEYNSHYQISLPKIKEE